MTDIGIIGCGNMGAAIARQLRKQEGFTVHLHDADETTLERVSSELSVSAHSLDELLERCPLILLAVKPQVLPSLYQRLRKEKKTKWISIAAGVSLETLEKGLGTSQVIRFMPNMGAAAAASVTAMCTSPECSEEFIAEGELIAASFGSVHRIDEKLMSVFTGVSGSGIAYLFSMFHHMAMGGVQQGLPYPKALAIAAETAKSAASMITLTGEHPVSLVTKVCSPSGTTIEAMKTLEEEGFGSAVMNAVAAASAKARELEEEARKREELT